MVLTCWLIGLMLTGFRTPTNLPGDSHPVFFGLSHAESYGALQFQLLEIFAAHLFHIFTFLKFGSTYEKLVWRAL